MGKNLLIASLISIAVLAAFYSTQESRIDAFEEWKGKFGVSWAPEEEAYRRLIFEKNVILVNKHNADKTQTYQKGINQFTVFTDEEFVTRFLTPMPMVGVPTSNSEYKLLGDVDWTSQGKVSHVKNQGQCGSCWAFSATGVMESWALFKGQTVDLSEQQLVDCSRAQGNQGCNGGWPSNALKYVAAKGIASTSQYAYTGKDGSCRIDGGSFKIAGQKAATGCAGLTSAITASPVSVTVDATNWSAYKSGVFTNCAASINHAVLLVGVAGGNWKIKNSWGTSWGESGFIRLGAGNVCGLCAYAGVIPV